MLEILRAGNALLQTWNQPVAALYAQLHAGSVQGAEQRLLPRLRGKYAKRQMAEMRAPQELSFPPSAAV